MVPIPVHGVALERNARADVDPRLGAVSDALRYGVTFRKTSRLVSGLLAVACRDPSPTEPTHESTGVPYDSEGESDTGCVAPLRATPAPQDHAVCCGCLCLDAAWSCSTDTCLAADGKVHALAPEAGFLETPSHAFRVDGTEYVSARQRMWYVFRPAKEAAPTTPLLVIFNGGPGAGSGILFGANTSDYTLDPHRTEAIGVTEHPWTEFAHLLYVDAAYAGFSYALPPDEAPWSAEHDASSMWHTVLAFIERHPALARAEIVPVGESYGGLRAILMLEQALDPDALADPESSYLDPTLREAFARHQRERTPPCDAETGSAPAPASSRMVSIQGALVGLSSLGGGPREGCVSDPDMYACQHPAGWTRTTLLQMFARLRTPAVLSEVTGVDVSTIAWMYGQERARATPVTGDEYGSEERAMRAMFGELPAGQQYYIGAASSAGQHQGSVGELLDSRVIMATFLDVAEQAEIFITDATYDLVIQSPLLVPVLQTSNRVANVFIAEGDDRHRELRIDSFGDEPGTGRTRTFPFVTYEAGHMLTLFEPSRFAEDLRFWLGAQRP